MTPPIIKISAYKAWKGKPGCKPYDTDFYTEMDRIKTGYYKVIAEKYRSIADSEERKRYKVNELPSLSISAVCKDWRRASNVVNHTGLLNLDIDAKSNEHISDWGEVRDKIFAMPGVVASFLSVSGAGVTFVVKIRPEQHRDCFFSIMDGMKEYMGIQIDPGLHDIVRLRFVSDDPQARIRYNFDEIPLSEPSASYLQGKKTFGVEQTILQPIGEADSEYNFMEAVKKAEKQFAFQKGSKWSFLIIVAGACNVMGMSMDYCRQMVLQHYGDKRDDATIDQLLKPISDIYRLYKDQHNTFNIQAAFERFNYKIKQHLIYDWLHVGKRPSPEEIIQICEKFEANKERVIPIVDRVFGEYETEFGYNNFPKISKVQCWLSRQWEFRFNVVTGQPEMSQPGDTELSTVNPDEIYRQLLMKGFKCSLSDIKSLMKSAFVKPYDPLLDYFNGLTYDGQDHIDTLAGYVKTTDFGFWDLQFKKALVRSIACGLGKKENRMVMVLFGKKQETGKSTFIRFLSPWGTEKYFTESPIIGGNAKDTEIRFSENFIYNIEELAGLSRVDVNKLKADISKSSIKERRAYATFETTAPRRCNFWASTNQKEFLHDDENTRWLVFDVVDINWCYKQDIDIHSVWAQAWRLYKDGFDFELNKDEKWIRDNMNIDYRYKRAEEDLLQRYFAPGKEYVHRFFSATEIAMHINGLHPSAKVNPNNVGRTLKEVYGIESTQVKINGKNTRGYWLKQGYSDPDLPEK